MTTQVIISIPHIQAGKAVSVKRINPQDGAVHEEVKVTGAGNGGQAVLQLIVHDGQKLDISEVNA